MRLLILAALAFALAPQLALAAGWQEYRYQDAGFMVQFPTTPTVTKLTIPGPQGAVLPATVYSADDPDARYTVTVADYAATSADQAGAIADAVKAYGRLGNITVNVSERIDREFGRELSVTRPDGARSQVAIFFLDHKLYEVEGKALAPNPDAGSGKTVRFLQSLVFVGQGRELGRPEDQFPAGGPGGGFGGGPGQGPGGRRRPPPEAFAACAGKQAGDSVQFTGRRGLVQATCRQTPDGLAARPQRPPGEGPGGDRGPRGSDAGPPGEPPPQ